MVITRSHNPLLLVLGLVRLLIVLGLTICVVPAIAITRLCNRNLPFTCARVWARLILLGIGVHQTRQGTAANWDTRSVIICNHLGYLDIPVILVSLQIPFCFIADSELFRVPLLGLAMRLSGHLPIWRTGHKRIQKTMQDAADLVRQDLPVVIFPEGGINREEDRDGYCRVLFGFSRIALDAGAKVYQVTLRGTGEAQRNFLRFCKRTSSILHEQTITLPETDTRESRQALASLVDERSRAAMAVLAAK